VRKAYRNVNGGNHASKEEGSDQEASSKDDQEASSEDDQEVHAQGGQEALGATDAALTTATISTVNPPSF
jgi:hypothetical protein